jgi:hypothetical protein
MDANTLLAILVLQSVPLTPQTMVEVHAVMQAEPELAEKWLRIRDCEAHRESVIGLTQAAIDKHLAAGRTSDVLRILRKCPMPPPAL